MARSAVAPAKRVGERGGASSLKADNFSSRVLSITPRVFRHVSNS